MSPDGFAVTVLGPVSVQYADAENMRPLSRSKRVLLAAMVAAGPGGIQAERLAEAVWPDGTQGAAALRMAVARLRDHLAPGLLPEANDGRYLLAASPSDVDAWRLESLAFDGNDLDTTPDELRELLAPLEPYEGIDGGDLVDGARSRVHHAQRRLLDRIAKEAPDRLGGEFLGHLVHHLDLDPFNESILAMAASVQARSGNRRAAIQLLSNARTRFADKGLTLSGALNGLEQRLLEGGPAEAPTVPVVIDAELRDGLIDLRRTPLAGPTDNLDNLVALLDDADRNLVRVAVTGPSGVGKTRLCVEVAAAAIERGIAVVYAAATPNSDAALGPLLAVLPELREPVRALLTSDLDADARRAALWSTATNALVERARRGPVLVIVDDCQWLDSQTAELVEFLARSSFENRVMLVIVGRDDPTVETSRWSAFASQFRRLGLAAEVEVEPLDGESVAELVDRAHPGMGLMLAHRVSEELARATGGLPAVVAALLPQIDDELLALPALRSLSPDRMLDGLVSSLPREARRVGAVGALVGAEFDLAAVRHISGLSEDEVLAAVDTLVRRELVAEQSAEVFSMAHVLIQGAFLRNELESQLVRWHRAAAEYFADDVHRRAHHQARAATDGDDAETAASLLASAHAYVREGLHREATADFASARRLSPEGLAPADAGQYARALDLSGFDQIARRVRRAAFAQALGAGDHVTALVVATSGLPESEPVDGDPELVAQLDAIDPSRLEQADQHALTCHLARQLAIVGRVAEAAAVASRSLESATSPRQINQSALTTRCAIAAAAPPAQRLAELERATLILEGLSAHARSEYYGVLVIDRYEAGDLVGARAARAELADQGAGTSPLRHWHGLLFDAMVATDTDDEPASSARDVALEYALRYGITEAENARFAPEYVDRWLGDGLEEFYPLLEADAMPAADSALGRAGAVGIRELLGQQRRALSEAETLAREILDAPLAQSIASLAVIAGVLGHSADRALVDAVYEKLAARGRSMVVVGACVTCIGPVHRYLARLTPDTDQRIQHLRQAISLADETGLARWRRVTRADLRVALAARAEAMPTEHGPRVRPGPDRE